MKKRLFIVIPAILGGCGTLDNRTILINAGDLKERAMDIMGLPYDHQFEQQKEA
ncbi:hypothetical protein [Shewanella algae]|uniref:hypothetical protein n=1 Tax=Shewanella algae TaxID=38313 RepID=UPI0031F56549